MVGLLTGWHSWLLYALLPLGWTAVLAAMAGRSATLQPKHKPVFSFRPAGEGRLRESGSRSRSSKELAIELTRALLGDRRRAL